MRRIFVLAHTIILCLLLCACGIKGKTGVDEAALLRTKLLEADGLTFNAVLRCDYGDRVWDCKLAFEGKADQAVLTVLEPELISGLEIRLENGLSQLCYDGAALNTGDIFGEGISAAEAVPCILRAWSEAYIRETYKEKIDAQQMTVLVLEVDAEKVVCIWFNEDAVPLKAELQNAGKTVVFCSFEGFTYR